MANRKAATKVKTPEKAKTAVVPTGAITRSAALGGTGAGLMPTGGITDALALDADVSDEMAAIAPTFGDVLLSIGTGVADSQAALDAGLVEAAKMLSETKIEVVTDVVQKLNEDGLPIGGDSSDILSHEVSLINFIPPTVHQWERVALSMDLSVGELERTSGMTFHRRQYESSTSGHGLFWGYLGWFSTNKKETTTRQSSYSERESDWAQGQVRLDAELRPRETAQFPVPADVTIGPQIYFSQGSVLETITSGVVTARAVDLIIKVRKADGSVNPGVIIEFDADRFRFSFASGDGFSGSTTNADGEVKVTVTRDIPNARFMRAIRGTVIARLGQIEKKYEISL